MRLSITLIILLVISLSCNRLPQTATNVSEQNFKGTIYIAGAYALAPLIHACADSFQVKYPDIDILVKATGHETALRMLGSDSIQLAMISRKLGKLEEHDYFAVSVAKTGVVLIFNPKNPIREYILSQGLTINDLQKIFSDDRQSFWNEYTVRGERAPVNAYVRQDQSGAAEVLADFLFMTPSELKGLPVNGEDEMIAAIQKDSLGLGFCNINDAFDLKSKERIDGIEFLPVDLNMNRYIEDRERICSNLDEFQNSICNNSYPIKLSRNLYLVAKSKPADPLIIAFIDYVMTEGQELVIPMGYSRVPESMIKYNRYLLR